MYTGDADNLEGSFINAHFINYHGLDILALPLHNLVITVHYINIGMPRMCNADCDKNKTAKTARGTSNSIKLKQN